MKKKRLNEMHEYPQLADGTRVIQNSRSKEGLVQALNKHIDEYSLIYDDNFEIIIGTDSQKTGLKRIGNKKGIDKRGFGSVVIFDAGNEYRTLVMNRYTQLWPFSKKKYLLQELHDSLFLLKKVVRSFDEKKVPVTLEVGINISPKHGSHIAYASANEILARKNILRIIENGDISVQFKGSLGYKDEAIRFADRLCRGKFGF